MRYTRCLLALVLVLLYVSTARSQTTSSDVNQLRQQIDALQRQLQKLENTAQLDSRVTQLGTKRATTREPEVTVRIYDLSDLFALAPAYPARYSGALGGGNQPMFPHSTATSSGTGFGGMGGGGGFYAVPDTMAKLPTPAQHHLAQINQGSSSGAASVDSRTSMDELITAITSTIAPTTWQEVGGPGSIARMGNSLLISTDRQTHEQIEELLTLFRKKWGTLRTISVRATWLWLTDEQLSRLLPGDGLQKLGDLEAYGIVDDAAWQKLSAEQQAGGVDQRARYRAIVTCYNGQTVSTVSGGQTLVVTQLEPFVIKAEGEKEKDHVVFRPVSLPIQEGAALQITPMANTSGKFVVVDIHSRINKLRDRPAPARPVDRKPPAPDEVSPEKLLSALDRPLLMTSELATTLRAPVDRTVLVGGMTFESEPRPGEPNLYLFVKLSVQELRDDVNRTKQQPETVPDAKVPEPGLKGE